jgi:EAL domain-containing protein (putative c-di-GMP-specific phosphodiesterase class I)
LETGSSRLAEFARCVHAYGRTQSRARAVDLHGVQPTAGQSGLEPVDWPAALHQAFAEPWRVRPAFQPIVDLERRTVWGFQVLDLTPWGADVDVDDLTIVAEQVRSGGAGLALVAGASPGGLDALPRLHPEVLKLGRDYIGEIDSDPARGAR